MNYLDQYISLVHHLAPDELSSLIEFVNTILIIMHDLNQLLNDIQHCLLSRLFQLLIVIDLLLLNIMIGLSALMLLHIHLHHHHLLLLRIQVLLLTIEILLILSLDS